MLLELLHKALYALISGFSELFFVSTKAHQMLYRTITGFDLGDSLLSLGIHLGCLIALWMNCNKRIKHLRGERRLVRSTKRRRGRQPDVTALMDIRIMNTAVLPLLLGFFFLRNASVWINSALRVAFVLMINGAILVLPRLRPSGNKNGRSFSRLDCILMGLCGALGAVPGFSTLGCTYSVSTARGAEKNYALELSILLMIPAVATLLCFDVYGCFAASTAITGMHMLGALVGTLVSFAGALMALNLIRFICNRSNTVAFAYYSWGFAMFLFLIYLFVA